MQRGAGRRSGRPVDACRRGVAGGSGGGGGQGKVSTEVMYRLQVVHKVGMAGQGAPQPQGAAASCRQRPPPSPSSSRQPVLHCVLAIWPPRRPLLLHLLDALQGGLAHWRACPLLLPCLRLRGGGGGGGSGGPKCAQQRREAGSLMAACESVAGQSWPATTCTWLAGHRLHQTLHHPPAVLCPGSPPPPPLRGPRGPLRCQAAGCAARCDKSRRQGRPPCRSSHP